MRVIAGKYRGKILAKFKGEAIRPTSDRVKESVFQILSERLAEARVLDLFCGSGALGIECLSRGAAEAVFNDASGESLRLLKRNLERISEPYRIENRDFRGCLQSAEGKFDLIFSDPPYAEDYLGEILRLVSQRGLLRAGGLVVHESEREETIPPDWTLRDRRGYGRTTIYFLEKNQ